MQLSDNIASNPLSRADGSALWTTGATKALVAINGPIEVPRREELVSETTVDIQFRHISGYSGTSFL
jgi:exosome complex component RRP46